MNNNFGLEYHLVHSCNLKCAGCSHYSSLLDKLTFISKEQIEIEMNLLRTRTNNGDALRWLRLLGGEPLLHPDLTDCLNIIRNIFPKTRVTLVTNGINLHKMSDTFYKVCQYNDIEILVTDYGLIDINNVLHLIKSKGVKIDIYQTCRDWYFQNIRLTEEINDCFNQCYHRKQCINYKEEKIFLCPQMAYIDIFNKSFNTKIIVKENEYIDLNKISNYDELIRLLSSLHPDFCSIYCNCTSPNGNPEKIGKRYTTKKDIKEFCKL